MKWQQIKKSFQIDRILRNFPQIKLIPVTGAQLGRHSPNKLSILGTVKLLLTMSVGQDNTDPPPTVRGMKKLDRMSFKKTIFVPTVHVPISAMDRITGSKFLKQSFLKMPGISPFIDVEDKELKDKVKLLLLKPSFGAEAQEMSPEIKTKLEESSVDLNTWKLMNIDLNYENWNYGEVINAIIPEDSEGFGSFSTIGHILHVNLKPDLLDYKEIIGEVLLDKVPYAKTVVNKTNIIDNTFRNFKMEVIAGEEDFIATVKEHGCVFKMDFSKVYWNSRLGTEHQHLVMQFNPGDMVFDMFAGIGPFAIPASKRKCTVYANDLNPESYKWLEENKKINKLKNPLHTYNMDGRDFARNIMADVIGKLVSGTLEGHEHSVPVNVHIVMNLPALAIEFIDVFPGLLSKYQDLINDAVLFPKFIVYCYCFHKGKNENQAIENRLQEYLGAMPEYVFVRLVRNVAPGKNMYCVKFTLSTELLLSKPKDDSCAVLEDVNEPQAKKIKLESSN